MAESCLNCGAAILTVEDTQTFPYGIGDFEVMLSATVPVRFCVRCGMSYTDCEGEDARDAAVKDYLAFVPFAAYVAAYGCARG
jgi:YgiT-type zinc finger domain-containing protein